MRPLFPLAVLLVALAPASVLAYGTLEPVNDLGTTLRQNAADPALEARDEAYETAGLPASQRRIDYGEDNSTWSVYKDENVNGQRDEGEQNDTLAGVQLSNVTIPPIRIDGNLTDHAQANASALGLWFRVCTDRAQDGLADGTARGLRCGGDLDGDGTGDTAEITAGRNPLRPREDRILPALP